MINHLRTLIMNSAPAPASEFEEFIPGTFIPLPLLREHSAVQQKIAPVSFTRRTRNLLATVAARIASSHRSYHMISSIDRREKLILTDSDISLVPSTLVTRTGGAEVVVQGILNPVADKGCYQKKWRLGRDGASSISVVDAESFERTSIDLSFSGDCSNQVEIDGSGIRVGVVGASSVPVFTMDVTATHPMSFDLHEVVSGLRTSDVISDIFFINDRAAGRALMDEFYSSDRKEEALAAALIAYGVSVTEKILLK